MDVTAPRPMMEELVIDEALPVELMVAPLPVELIYDSEMDTSAMKNVLLIHDGVADYNTFVTAANSDTFPIVYNNHSSKEAMLQLLKDKFVSISRIAFVFHNGEMNPSKTFLDDEPLFTNEDLGGVDDFSNNMKFVIEISNTFQIANLDFLACNTLQYDSWKTYYRLLEDNTKVTIGASDDLTGNLKYGGDWVLESTNEDIKSMYFTDLIENYQNTLITSSITQSGGTIYLRQQTVTGPVQWSPDNLTGWDTIAWPLTIINSSTTSTLNVKLTTNITFGDLATGSVGGTNGYIIIGSDRISIDGLDSASGKNNVVTINGITNYPGLIRNGTITVTGFTDITIENIGVVTAGVSSLASRGGWVCQAYFGLRISSGVIKALNCYSTGVISGSITGGIFGGNVGQLASGAAIIYAENCYSTGIISGQYAGGIFGLNACRQSIDSAQLYVTNCYSTGAISGQRAGGIFGAQGGSFISGTAQVYAENCYSTGEISGKYAGGIFGLNSGYQPLDSAQIYAKNCYSTGAISGQYVGGIWGAQAGIFAFDSSQVYAENCYSTGAISGLESGGIFGGDAGYQAAGTAQIYAKNCYSTGEISVDSLGSGGIFGFWAGEAALGNAQIYAENCYSTGAIGGADSGGIFGSKVGLTALDNAQIYAINCYSTGEISGADSGGIFGSKVGESATGSAQISAKNCYTTGTISGTSTGGIFGYKAGDLATSPVQISAINCYTIGIISGTSAGGIYGPDATLNTTVNCIASNNNTWADADAITTIDASTNKTASNIWLDYSTLTTVPWLLNSFDSIIYNPDSQTILFGTIGTSPAGLFAPPSYNYIIYNDPTLTGITIDVNTGVITCQGTVPGGTYIINVLVGQLLDNVYRAYNRNIYTFIVEAVVPGAPFNLVASAGNRQVSISFDVNDGGSPITNLSYSLNGGSFISFSPAQNSSPVTIFHLINDRKYNIELKATNAVGTGSASSAVSVTPVLCFNKGTLILCLNENSDEEYIRVENLKKGDLVKSYNHGYRKIEAIQEGNMINNPDNVFKCMYKMIKNDTNGLIEDLIVTGGHSILVDDLGEYKKMNNTMWNREHYTKVVRINKKMEVIKERIDVLKENRDRNMNMNRRGLVKNFNQRIDDLETKVQTLKKELSIESWKEDGNHIPQIDDKYMLFAAVSKDFVQLVNNDVYTWYHFCLEDGGDNNKRFGVWSNGILSETPSKNQMTQMDNIIND